MARFFPLIMALQAFCLYHAYSNKINQKWYWIILFFPFIGSLIYLYSNFYSQRNLDTVAEGVKETFVKNYTIDKLERNLKFSNTFSNKVELADEYHKVGEYERALDLYNSCKEGIHEDDPSLLSKLIRSHYALENFEEVTQYGLQLVNDREFKSSAEKSMYAWSFSEIGNQEKAIEVFEELDIQFSNYQGRIDYIHFLIHTENHLQAREKINTILEELESMDSFEKKLNKAIIKEVKYLDKTT